MKTSLTLHTKLRDDTLLELDEKLKSLLIALIDSLNPPIHRGIELERTRLLIDDKHNLIIGYNTKLKCLFEIIDATSSTLFIIGNESTKKIDTRLLINSGNFHTKEKHSLLADIQEITELAAIFIDSSAKIEVWEKIKSLI